MVGTILPMAFGMVVGNLDRELRAFLGKAALVMIPFFAFGLGASLDLNKVWMAGVLGWVSAWASSSSPASPCSSSIARPAAPVSQASRPHRPPATRQPFPPSSPRSTRLCRCEKRRHHSGRRFGRHHRGPCADGHRLRGRPFRPFQEPRRRGGRGGRSRTLCRSAALTFRQAAIVPM